MQSIAIAHLKGGVGKTTAAVNLAHLASASGVWTLLVDLDAQGAAGFIFRINTEDAAKAKAVAQNKKGVGDHIFATNFPNLDLLPGSLSFRKLPQLLADQKDGTNAVLEMLKRLGEGYDLVVVDAPAGLHLESEAIMRAVDLVLVPLLPSPLSIDSYDKMRGFVDNRRRKSGKPELRGFFSMVDRRRKLHRETVESVVERYTDIWPVEIPYASVVEQMSSRRLPLNELPRAGKALTSYRLLWDYTATAVGVNGGSGAAGPS